MKVPNAFDHIFTVYGKPGLKIDFGPLYDYSTVPFVWAGGGNFDWPHRGILYGEVWDDAGTVRVDIKGGRGAGAGGPVYFLRGVYPGLNLWADFTPGDAGVNNTGARMRFRVAALPDLTAGPVPFVLMPTFADDNDISPDPVFRAEMPGYDDDDGNANPKGLAYWLAKAMRQLIGTDLPARIPNLFAASGMQNYFGSIVGTMDDPVASAGLPDIRTVSAIDQLREGQAKLALYLAANSQRNQKEFADLADALGQQYGEILDRIADANAPEEEKADETAESESGFIGFGEFARG